MNIKQLKKEKPVVKKSNESNLFYKNTAFINIIILKMLIVFHLSSFSLVLL